MKEQELDVAELVSRLHDKQPGQDSDDELRDLDELSQLANYQFPPEQDEDDAPEDYDSDDDDTETEPSIPHPDQNAVPMPATTETPTTQSRRPPVSFNIESVPVEHKRTNRPIPSFELAIGIWCKSVGVSRALFISP